MITLEKLIRLMQVFDKLAFRLSAIIIGGGTSLAIYTKIPEVFIAALLFGGIAWALRGYTQGFEYNFKVKLEKRNAKEGP